MSGEELVSKIIDKINNDESYSESELDDVFEKYPNTLLIAQKAMIKDDYKLLKHVYKPSEELCSYALTINRDAIDFITDYDLRNRMIEKFNIKPVFTISSASEDEDENKIENTVPDNENITGIRELSSSSVSLDIDDTNAPSESESESESELENQDGDNTHTRTWVILWLFSCVVVWICRYVCF